ncbi:MAG TPA: heme-binding domain-containing protein [Verrucomicrobiae bacterium]|jgi:hypothetical protein
MRKKLYWVIAGLAIVFALMQLANPSRVNPPVTNPFPITNAPPQVAAMLRAACYDCHSDETRWPWYSHIAPMSWQIANDVNEGRNNLNLSDWPTDPMRAAKRMEAMSEEIDYHEMPLKKYTLIHADARLTDSQRQAMEDWLQAQAKILKAQK